MHFITGILFRQSRMDRQIHCLNSWRDHQVTLVQHESEKEFVDAFFPDYPIFYHGGPKRTLIIEYMKVIQELNKTSVLINSDIELAGPLFWEDVPDKTLQLGIRHNYSHKSPPSPEKWGFDAFRLTPAMAATVKDIGFQIGIPVWDYWMVHHFDKLGYKLQASKLPIFLHESHPLNWTPEQHKEGYVIMKKQLGINKRTLQKWRASCCIAGSNS